MKCGIIGIKLSLPLIIAYLMVKFKVKAIMSSVLDKAMVESSMPLEYEYLHHGVTQLGKQSKFKQKHCVIAS